MTDIAAPAPIPPSGKRQPDPPTGEEEQDAKKSKQGEESKMINTDEIPKDLLDHLPESVINEIPEDFLRSVHLTRDDLKLTDDERMDLSLHRSLQELADEEGDFPREVVYPEPEYGPDDPLPKGHEWASFHPFSDQKDFIVKMCCDRCGVLLDHWPADCPKKKVQGSTGESDDDEFDQEGF